MKYIVTSGCSFTRQYRRIGITGNEYDFMNDAISQVLKLNLKRLLK